jgi:hypothetical protein
MTKEEKQRYKECKKTETKERSKRNKNKPTACKKQPKQQHGTLTNENYAVLFDTLQETKDKNDGKEIILKNIF